MLVILVSSLNTWRAQKIELPYLHIGRPADTSSKMRRSNQPQHYADRMSPEVKPAAAVCTNPKTKMISKP